MRPATPATNFQVGCHDALRRGGTAPLFTRLTVTGAAPPDSNVLRGAVWPEPTQNCATESGVPLDDAQRQVLAEIRRPSSTLHYVTSLAGGWKTALAHCPLKTLLENTREFIPDALLFTVCLRTPCVRKLYWISSSQRPWHAHVCCNLSV